MNLEINGTVRFISDFRELNKTTKSLLFLNIQDLLLKLQGFRYALSLDLTMGNYNISSSQVFSKLYKIILPWVKFGY